MRTSSTTEVVSDWAATDGAESELGHLDRSSVEVAKGFRAATAHPDSIEKVERIEGLAKYLWDDLLTPGAAVDAADAVLFARFFSHVGFFFKYKPYGVKIASPFGYSLFDLCDGQGFSFQVHLEPKLEAFHILRTKPRSLVYVASVPEWESEGHAWARAFFQNEEADEPPAVWRPARGDATAIVETQTVHSVLGCVVEEFAGCSVDAVKRLYDPYPRTFALPAAHPVPQELLRGAYPGLPRRILHRNASGWRAERVAADATVQTMIDVPDELWGGRVRCTTERPYSVPATEEFVTVVVPMDGGVVVDIAGTRVDLDLGSLVCLPPQVAASVTASGGATTLAVHQVARRLVQTEWTR